MNSQLPSQVPQGVLDNINIKNINPATNLPDPDANLSIAGILTGGKVNILTLVFFFIGLLFLANIIIAASEYITSSGDPKRIQAANSRLTNGITGIIITLAAFLIIRLLTDMIGLQQPLI